MLKIQADLATVSAHDINTINNGKQGMNEHSTI
jgi:hypothetical protein